MAEPVTPGTFIPHDTVVRSRSAGGGNGLNDLLLLCSIVLLVASIALAVGVFLYAQLLQTQSASKVAQLQTAEAAFEPSLIQELTRLDDRMHAADVVLAAHVAPTAFFDALNAATLQTVSFTTLDYEQTSANSITVKMQGVAQSVNSIALQADIFSKNGVITSPIFSNIARQADGIHFDLTASVNPSSIAYASVLSSQANTPAASGATPASSTPTSPFGTPPTASSTVPAASSTPGGAPQQQQQ